MMLVLLGPILTLKESLIYEGSPDSPSFMHKGTLTENRVD